MRPFPAITPLVLLAAGAPDLAPDPASAAAQRGATTRQVRRGPEESPQAQVALTQQRLERLAEQIRADVEAIRGKPFKQPVAVELTDAATFQALARRSLERELEPERLAVDEIVAKLLGMIPGDMDLQEMTLGLLEDRLGGFYDAETTTCYVLDSISENLARVVMAHELGLAFDEQHHALRERALAEGNGDLAFACRALIHGSGFEFLSRWALQYRDDIDHGELMRAQEAVPADLLENAPPFVWKPLLATYSQGQSFLRRQARASILGSPALMRDLEAAFAHPPRSTEQLLHPVKFWNPDRRDEPLAVSCDVGGLASEWRMLRRDTFGELYAAILTTPFEERGGMDVSVFGMLGMSFTNAAASGWGGDRYVLLERDGGHLLRMCMRWDGAADAQEFHDALTGLRSGIEAARSLMPGFDPGRSGFRVELSADSEVLVTSWVGLETALVEEALESIRFGE